LTLMMTFQDAALASPLPMATPVRAAPAQKILLAALFVTVLSSFFVYVQPSPYEYLMALLALACIVARVRVDRRILILAFLFLILFINGLAATSTVFHRPDVVVFFGISIYLGVTGIIFACLFSEDCVRRVQVMRVAYILAAIAAATSAVVGYFDVISASETLMYGGRARGTFKDPNVLGPFLVLPLLFLIQSVMLNGLRLRYIAALMIVLTGLLLTFSRGAWGHFLLSTALMLWLMLIAARTPRLRMRIIALSIAAMVLAAIFLTLLLSIDDVREMFEQRARLLQSYDAGTSGGRFETQEQSITEILRNPLGMGALEFGRIYGIPPHNIYLWVMVSYGWLGGLAYIAHVLATLGIGFRAVLIRTPWQFPLCAIYAAYVGLVAEGFIIDTDHWRHYYLLLGGVWGLSIASLNHIQATPETRGGTSL
jgi:O-antigen ligase